MIRLFVLVCIVLLLMLQFLLTIAVRVPHDTLTLTIINGDERITLNWKLTGQYLANHNLPVWLAWKNREPELVPNGIEDLGQFVMYHDVDKSSAVVYSEKSKSLFGIIDTRFYIDGLPLNEIGPDKFHHVDESYVKSRGESESEMFHDDPPNRPQSCDISALDMASINSFIESLPNFAVHNIKPQSSQLCPDTYNEDHGDDNKLDQTHQPEEIFYAEILVFISNDIVRLHNAIDHNLMSIVLYYLVHFNAIDMLYAKLMQDRVVIHLNIAGLVLEAEQLVFPYVFIAEQPQPNHFIQASVTSYQMQSYLQKHQNIFSEDSYDFFYLSTTYKLCVGTDLLLGIAAYKVNVYEFRKIGHYHSFGMVIEYRSNHGDYVGSAHEIAHVFDVTHDSQTDGCFVNSIQCHAILQKIVSYCRNCLKWSESSREQFKKYVSTNLNRCYLLNPPRSLHPHGDPITTIVPSQQCKCYGYQYHIGPRHYLDAVGWNECSRKLACLHHDQLVDDNIPKPIDGTPCDLNKVCWRRECRLLSPQTRTWRGKMNEHNGNSCDNKRMRKH